MRLGFLAAVWEDLARTSVPWLEPGFGPAARWWGPADGGPVELDAPPGTVAAADVVAALR